MIIFVPFRSFYYGFSCRPEKTLLARFRMAFRLFLRSFYSLRENDNWFLWLRTQDVSLLGANKCFLIKPLRPYMAKSWSVEDRSKCLINTINFINSNGFFSGIFNAKKKQVFINDLENKGCIILIFSSTDNKEGEITLSLHVTGIDSYIKRVIFSFDKHEGALVARIGCVQGNFIHYATEKDLQKIFYGLRPGALLIFVLQIILPSLGVHLIHGISNKEHVFSSKHRLSKKLGKKIRTLVFDYDAFWQELGGSRLSTGWFAIPMTPTKRDETHIPSKKRSMYRKRYEFMEHVKSQLKQVA